VLDEAEKADLETATGIEGIDDEIALLRVKIKSVLEKDPENVRLIMEATSTLAGLVRTRFKISKVQQRGLREAIGKVIREVALPLGINVGSAVLTKKLSG
jgi:hypothetical protein